jgi:hypothetical protein
VGTARRHEFKGSSQKAITILQIGGGHLQNKASDIAFGACG